MFGINGWEFILLAVLAVFILGPERLPEYAAKLARLVHQVRLMADGARGQLREQLGPEFDDIDWRQYDPRQYDPRRIVREALAEPLPGTEPEGGPDGDDPGYDAAAAAYPRPPVEHDATLPTPYDVDAT
ncbi:MAG: preprotein translocase subunit TatA [Micrococcales bacterium]|nr:preprotein translocase subunit TatA [Micrococcales bacterium]